MIIRASLLPASLAIGVLWLPLPAAAVTEPPSDLTGKVAVIATFTSRDNFSNEYRYEVSVRNIGSDVIAGDSLLLVLDRVINVGGGDREPLKNEPLLDRMEILGADGETPDGRPFFRLTVDEGQDLMPQTESQPVTVRLRNRDYVQVFTPAFRVIGARRIPRAAKAPEPLLLAPGTKAPSGKQAVDALVRLLIKKGLLTEEEWRAAQQPTP